MWNMYSAPWAGQTLPGTSVMPWTVTCDGLRSNMTSAAPSSPNSPESVTNRTMSRPAAHDRPDDNPGSSMSATSISPTGKPNMYPQYNANSPRIEQSAGPRGGLDAGEVVVMDTVESPQAVRMSSKIGNRRYSHSTALGKVLPAGLNDKEVQRLLRVKGTPKLTEQTLVSKRAVLAEVQKVRPQGWALDNRENEIDGRCIACHRGSGRARGGGAQRLGAGVSHGHGPGAPWFPSCAAPASRSRARCEGEGCEAGGLARLLPARVNSGLHQLSGQCRTAGPYGIGDRWVDRDGIFRTGYRGSM